jgi:uncharacterized protein
MPSKKVRLVLLALGAATIMQLGCGRVRSLQKACDAGDPKRCDDLARIYQKGDGVQKDVAKATQLYQKACIGGEARSCGSLGLIYEKGDANVQKDIGRAAELYQKACDGGFAEGCFDLAKTYLSGAAMSRVLEDLHAGLAGKQDVEKVEKAERLYEKACDGGFAQGCSDSAEWNLSVTLDMRRHGFVEKKEGNEYIAKLFQKGCGGGVVKACFNGGQMYHDGTIVQKDEAKAIQLYQKACDGGQAEGCANGGQMYHDGAGVQKDEDKAIKLFQRGCNGDIATACFEVGQMYHDGTIVQKDEAKASQFFRKACDGGDPNGCAHVGYRLITNNDGLSCAFSQDLSFSFASLSGGTVSGSANHFACSDKMGKKREIELKSNDPSTNVKEGNRKLAILTKDFGTVLRGNEAGSFDHYEMTDNQIKKLRTFLGF